MRPQRTAGQQAGLVAAAAVAIIAAFGTGGWLALQRAQSQDSSALACRALADDNQRLTALVSAGESHLQIERAAQEKLAQENARLTAEIARLREELSVFQRLKNGGDARTAAGAMASNKTQMRQGAPSAAKLHNPGGERVPKREEE